MKNLDTTLFLKMLENGSNNLSNNHQLINTLNVFPVPDGDTGTNMNLTFTNGLKDAKKANSDNLGETAKALSRGLLMGARGNSGVILSQIFRGFAQGVEGLDSADVNQVANAFQEGKESAYKAVMRPVEGTILTVLRESSQKAYDYLLKNPDTTMIEYFEYLIEQAEISLDNTPELLPVLKEVGVVDSGGKGYLTVLEGFLKALKGETVTKLDDDEQESQVAESIDHEEFGYCTEFILRLEGPSLQTFDEDQFRKDLENLGDSLVVVRDEDLVKVHVHTLKPGNALNLGQRFGEFVKLKIDNMTEQHSELIDHKELVNESPREKYAIVSVVAGEGIVSLFKELRAKHIISGGQTMNPSTEDFVAKIENINADHIFVLPNNSNILMAANQAKEILTEKDIHVLETTSIPQGISACIMFNPEVEVDENVEEMTEAYKNTKTGQITYAIKDTQFESMEIKKDHFMGILDKKIVVTAEQKVEATKLLCNQLIDEDDELVTLITGEGVSEEENETVVEYIEDNFDVEVEVIDGEQPVYAFIIGVE